MAEILPGAGYAASMPWPVKLWRIPPSRWESGANAGLRGPHGVITMRAIPHTLRKTGQRNWLNSAESSLWKY